MQTERKNVDVEGNEVPDSKRTNVNPDKAREMNALLLILHWHEALIAGFQIKDRTNIDAVAELSSIILACHGRNKQVAKAGKLLDSRLSGDFKFAANDVKMLGKDCAELMEAIANEHGFRYSPYENDRSMATVTDLLYSVCAYRHSFAEVTLGNAFIKLQKVDETVYKMPLFSFGFNNTHAPYLYGCTFAPALQFKMKQYLGPITVMINLCMNKDQRYRKAWKDAFTQAFKRIPRVEDMANLLAGSTTRHTAMIRNLADLCIFGITKTPNKAFLPAAVLLALNMRESHTYKATFSTTPQNFVFRLDNSYLCESLKNIDFYGHGLLNVWNRAATELYSIKGDPDLMTPAQAAQVVLHAAIGTHKENLDLLKWMTGIDFQTRRMLGDCFKGRESSGHGVAVQLIPFKRFAKSASPTNYPACRRGGQISRSPTFSGRITVRVDDDSELFKILGGPTGYAGYFGPMTGFRALKIMHQMKERLKNRLTQDRMIQYEGTDFYQPNLESYGLEYGEKVEMNQPLRKIFFHHQEEE